MFNIIRNKENINIDKNQNKKGDEKLRLKDYMIIIVASIIGSLILTNFVRISTVQGHSMDYTLKDGGKILLNTFTYNVNEVERGDVLVVERNDLSIRYFVKRVIGVEGDTVEIKDNVVYLNGEALEEDYIKEEMYTDDLSVVIPDGKVFVMGDNRNNSLDSRSNIIGLIDVESEIVGKAIVFLPSFKAIN